MTTTAPESMNLTAAEILAKMRAADNGDGWRPIAEAPRDGTKIWAWQYGREQFVTWLAHSDREGEYWQDEADDEPEPSDWMLLPSPPRSAK